MPPATRSAIFYAALIACCTPWVTAPLGLFLGLIIGFTVGSALAEQQKWLTTKLLQASVVGLGFGLSASNAVAAIQQGFVYTIASIVGTLVVGRLIGKLAGLDDVTSHLLASGTAICGGSAIAAVGPAIGASSDRMSVSLATVFVLNSVALFLFPPIGHWLGFSQTQFGLWSALAIHDTSSVVGAAGVYGTGALAIATTIKLARALWIVPLALVSSWMFGRGQSTVAFPWFIALFVVAVAVSGYIPFASSVAIVARQGLTVTLFLVGSGINREQLRAVGVRPLLAGTATWIVVATVTAAVLWLM